MKTTMLLFIAPLLSCFHPILGATAPLAKFSVSDSAGCAPLSVHFINNSINAVSYGWNFGNGISSTAVNPSIVFSTPGTYTVTLIAYSSNGSANMIIKDSCITVFPKPAAGFTSPDNSQCEDIYPVQFNNTTVDGSSYLWDFGDGTTAAQTSPSHIYTSSGNFSVTLIAYSVAGCSDLIVMPQFALISPKPVVDITVDKTKACSLDSVFHFSALSANASGLIWDFGDGSSATGPFADHQYSLPGTYSVSVIATNASGCTDTIRENNFISVAAQANPAFTIDKNSGCAPLTVTFQSAVSTGYSFTWNFGDGSSSAQSNPVHIYTVKGYFTVSLTLTNGIACTYGFAVDSMILVSDPVMADFTVDTFSGCKPLTVHFSDNSANASSWLWDFGDGVISTLEDPVHTFFQKGNYPVTLVATDSNGCVSQIKKLNFISVNAPVANFAVTDTTGCAPFTVEFSTPASIGFDYQWDFSNGGGSSSTVTHTFDSGGYYSVSLVVTNTAGCRDTIVNKNYIHAIAPEVYYTPPPILVSCSPVTISFAGSSIGKSFWNWDFDDSTYSTSSNPVHSFDQPGIYSVSLSTIALNDCPVTLSEYNIIHVVTSSAGFEYIPDSCPSTGIQFLDTSVNPVSWLWNFGDGATSTDTNPYHTYPVPGSFTVTLEVTTVEGCTNRVTRYSYVTVLSCDSLIDMPPGLSFSSGEKDTAYIPDSIFSIPADTIFSCAPFTVSFFNPADSAIHWSWDFGDGDSSANPNPVHTFLKGGVFDVSLIVTYPSGNLDTLFGIFPIAIRVVDAKFAIDQVNKCYGADVSLTDSSVNAAYWQWNFGDGNSSTIQNPYHSYIQAGNFFLSLVASDSSGCTDMAGANIYSSIVKPVLNYQTENCISDSFSFSSSLEGFSLLQWNFGDGTTSNSDTAFHQYASGGSYPVFLTVYDSSGCSMIFPVPDTISVYNPIASFSTNGNHIGCNTLQLTFNNLSSGADTWDWNFGDGTGSSNKHPTHLYTTPGTYHVSLTAAKEGCSSHFLMPDSIVIFPASADFSFIQNDFCLPVTAQFTDLSQAPASWLWEFADGTTSSFQNPFHIYTQFPTGDAKLTITDTNGCVVSAIKPNVIAFKPDFDVSVSHGCVPLTVSFTDKSNNAVSWMWNFGNGIFSSDQNPVITYDSAAVYSVTLVAASAYGCTDTAQADSIITIQQVFAGFFSLSTLDDCNPVQVNFNDSSLYASGWKWNFGDGNTSTVENPLHLYSYPGKYSITLIAYSSLGCSDTVAMADYVMVKGPYAQFSTEITSGCPPLSIHFDNQTINSNSITWYFGDGDTSQAWSPDHTFTLAGAYTVSIFAEDTQGCKSNFSLSSPVMVFPEPMAQFTPSDASGCEPLTVDFFNISVSADTYVWNFGDSSISSDSFPQHTYSTAGNYEIGLIALNSYGCSDTFTFRSIQVNPVPAAGFFADVTNGCAPLTIHFYAEAGAPEGVAYWWNFGNGELTSDPEPSSVYTGGGGYSVSLIVTNSSGCSDTLVRKDYITTVKDAPPDPVQILTATVTSDTSVYMIWNESNAADFGGYILFRKNNSSENFEMIERIPDVNFTNFTDYSLNTLDHSYCYKIAAEDTCGNIIDKEAIQEYCTINVTALSTDDKITVEWSPYIGCPVNNYEIFKKKKEEADFKKITTVEKNVLSWQDTSWECGAEYVYRIIARGLCGNNISSSSDTSGSTPDSGSFVSQKMRVVYTTVVDNNSILTEWEKPLLAPQKLIAYKVFRSQDGSEYRHLTTLRADSLRFTDLEVRVTEHYYHYQIAPVYTCRYNTVHSNPGSSILLLGKTEKDRVNLRWTPYEKWDSDVKHYVIERQREDGTWEVVEIVDKDQRGFVDRFTY